MNVAFLDSDRASLESGEVAGAPFQGDGGGRAGAAGGDRALGGSFHGGELGGQGGKAMGGGGLADSGQHPELCGLQATCQNGVIRGTFGAACLELKATCELGCRAQMVNTTYYDSDYTVATQIARGALCNGVDEAGEGGSGGVSEGGSGGAAPLGEGGALRAGASGAD